MNIINWTCSNCGRNCSMKMNSCRKCGKVRPLYDFIDEPAPKTKTIIKNEPKKERKPRVSKDPLISDNEDKIYVSTLKMKDKK